MPLERDQKNFGLEAFKQALARQEGGFMRAATVILNDPKDLKQTDNERIADGVARRCALTGQFKKANCDVK